MPKKRRDPTGPRRPVKRQRLEGLTVTIQNCGTKGYAYAVVMHNDGKRLRQKYCRTKAEAEGIAQKWGIEAGNTGVAAALNITDPDKRALLEWKESLAAFGKTPGDAVAFYLEHLRRCKVSLTLRQVYEKVLAVKEREKKSIRYLQDLESRMNRFCGRFGDRMAAEVTASEISAWLHSLETAPVTINNYRRLISVLFAHAVKLGACERNPVEDVDALKQIPGDVGILTVAEARCLLDAAAQRSDILAAMAVGLFAGVRDAEIKRLHWTEINLTSGYIEIKASKSKSARRRLIPIRPVLQAWLDLCPVRTGPVWPAGERGRILHEQARRAAGFGAPEPAPAKDKAKDKTKDKALRTWPHNALRHSFASYHLAKFKEAQTLALELGHTGTALIFEHYREVVQPEAAEAFWGLYPGPHP